MATDDTYIFPSFDGDPGEAHRANMARLNELVADWKENPNAIEVLLSQAYSQKDATLVDFASDVLASIITEVARVAGIQRHEPSPAAGTITVETDGAETYSLPAGATLVAYLPDQTAVSLITTDDAVIPVGVTSVSSVPVQAVADGLIADLATPQPLDPDQTYNWLIDVSLDELTEIGSDGDDEGRYLDRASSGLGRLADQLILPGDVESFVGDIEGVGRVLVLPGVDAANPTSPLFDVERCLTIVITAPGGLPPSTGLLNTVQAAVDARREASFKFFVIGPAYRPVSVALTVAAWRNDLDIAEAEVEAQLRAWLSPAAFGGREHGYGADAWSNTQTVRLGEVVSTADRAVSVDYVPPGLVTINGANADFTLTAPIAALPDPANTFVSVTVVEREP